MVSLTVGVSVGALLVGFVLGRLSTGRVVHRSSKDAGTSSACSPPTQVPQAKGNGENPNIEMMETAVFSSNSRVNLLTANGGSEC